MSDAGALVILHEDDSLLVVDKPAGIVVQRGYDPAEPVLYEQVSTYLAEKGEQAFLMQRLDRGTSGTIFFTKRSEVNAPLTRQFERKQIRKEYIALCSGSVHAQIIDAPLARIGPISFGVRSTGKRAVTGITPLDRADEATLLAVHLLTGRTHQIRAHLAAIGHPLIGDWLYGERNAARPMLHAFRLTLRHPVTREELSVVSPLPVDFVEEAGRRGVTIDRTITIETDGRWRRPVG